jgi:glycosyltransferase involved in cell wall biosynthesis
MSSVIHVTEALAGGVLTSLAQLIAAQHANGTRTTLVYTARPDTPSHTVLRQVFPEQTVIEEVSRRSGNPVRNLVSLASAARRLSRSDPAAVVHLHSSMAGGVCRLPGLRPTAAKRDRLFYSPHGYAFLREDVGRHSRKAIERTERILGRRGTSILVSASEEELARNLLGIRRTVILANAVDADLLDSVSRRNDVRRGRPLVAMVGRITYQKGPWRFANVARQLSDVADFVWLGDGASRDREKWFGTSPVDISGWLERRDLLNELSLADIVCFPTLWEGMPLALLEAQAMGIPAVASNIVGNQDVIADGETGILADTDDDLINGVARLISDVTLRREMGRAAAIRVRTHFDQSRLSRDALSVYSAGATPTPSHINR